MNNLFPTYTQPRSGPKTRDPILLPPWLEPCFVLDPSSGTLTLALATCSGAAALFPHPGPSSSQPPRHHEHACTVGHTHNLLDFPCRPAKLHTQRNFIKLPEPVGLVCTQLNVCIFKDFIF